MIQFRGITYDWNDSLGVVSAPNPGVHIGDLILCLVETGIGNTNLTLPLGFTVLDSASNTTQRLLSGYKVADSNDVAAASFTATSTQGGSTVMTITVAAFYGVDTSNPIDLHGGACLSSQTSSSYNLGVGTKLDTAVVMIVSCRRNTIQPTFSNWRQTLNDPIDWVEALDIQHQFTMDGRSLGCAYAHASSLTHGSTVVTLSLSSASVIMSVALATELAHSTFYPRSW